MFHPYGLFIGIAIVLGWSVAERIEPRVNKAAPWIIGFGLIGARLYHVIDLWSYYSLNYWQILAVWRGGLSIWGGLIAGSIVALIYFKGETPKVVAAIVTALPLAQAIGRIGNGVNGEFWDKIWVLPWWSVEAILDLALFGIMWGLSLRGLSSQVRIVVYLFGYFLIRLALNPFRADLR